MSATDAPQGKLTLTQIEADLLEAEAAFADADNRLRRAERDRQTALDNINRHQALFDQAIDEIRMRSTPGSTWQREVKAESLPLILSDADAVDHGPAMSPVKAASVSAEFRRLKEIAEPNSGDPILKVALARGGRA